ncbi:MAG TPA: dehydrogenase, partial [Gemmatimonadetes bacterium]|nr:dehydrogenase [Gemmatimonadota bacterium]
MATQEKEILKADDLAGLSAEQLLRFYRTMLTSRRIDEREINLRKQNKTFFQISSAGHEAIGVAIADHCRPGNDWFFTHYRDRSLVLALGQTPLDHFLAAVGAEADPATGGRQMPCHFSDVHLNIASSSSVVATQFLQAVGAAEASTKISRVPGLRDLVPSFDEDQIVLVCGGEGQTSEGEFWESLNTACNLSLPVVFVIEDNEYAISVPVEVQTAGGSISKLVSGFPNLYLVECDGTDIVDVYRAAGSAISHAREQRAPAFIHAHCTRPHSHSMSDDEGAYRTEKERAAQDLRDPITRTSVLLLESQAATAEELKDLELEIEAEVASAADKALASPQPAPETAMLHLFSEDCDPTSSDFDTEDDPQYGDDSLLTMVDLLNACLSSEMERDPRITVFGQDIADASREEALSEVKGKGGVFKVTHGLQRRFGSERVYNTPLAEANII